MFKGKFDFSSRFRILKGGKIALVIGAMLTSSIVNAATFFPWDNGGINTEFSTIENWNGSYDFSNSDHNGIINDYDVTINDTLNVAGNIYITGSDNGAQTPTSDASLTIENSGNLTIRSMNIGSYFGEPNATLTVTGPDAYLNATTSLVVGYQHEGTFNVNSGATVDIRRFQLGSSSNSSDSGASTDYWGKGISNISGTNTTVNVSSEIQIGYFGSGTINLIDNASLNYNSNLLDSDGNSFFRMGSAGGVYDVFQRNEIINITSGATLTSPVQIIMGYDINTSKTSTTDIFQINIGAAPGLSALAPGTLNAPVDLTYLKASKSINFNHTSDSYTHTGDIYNSHDPSGTGYILVPFAGETRSNKFGNVNLYSGSTEFTGNLSNFVGQMKVDGGLLVLGSNNTLSLGGNYVQTTNGTIKIGVLDDTTYGKLVVSDTATLPSNTKIIVDVSNPSFNFTTALTDGLPDVITATTLSSDGTFTVTDNSDFVDFEATKDGNSVDLNLIVATSSGGGSNSNNNSNSNEETVAVEAIKKETTHTDTFKAANQTMNLIHNIVEIRQNQVNNFNPGKTGENSGDEMMVDRNLWFKPFAGYGTQRDADGLNGFKLNTYGFGIGYDRTDKDDDTLGAAFFYTQGDVDVNNANDTVDIESYTGLLYGSNKLSNNIDFMYQLVFGVQNNESKRYNSSNALAAADYSGRNYAIDLKLMQEYSYSDSLKISPIAVATYRIFTSDSYSEVGTDTFDVDDATSEQQILKVGSIFTKTLDKNSRFITDLRVGYDFMHGKNSVYATAAGAPTPTPSTGIDNGGVVYNFGLSYEKSVGDSNFDIGYSLEGEGSDFQNHVISAKYVYKF